MAVAAPIQPSMSSRAELADQLRQLQDRRRLAERELARARGDAAAQVAHYRGIVQVRSAELEAAQGKLREAGVTLALQIAPLEASLGALDAELASTQAQLAEHDRSRRLQEPVRPKLVAELLGQFDSGAVDFRRSPQSSSEQEAQTQYRRGLRQLQQQIDGLSMYAFGQPPPAALMERCRGRGSAWFSTRDVRAPSWLLRYFGAPSVASMHQRSTFSAPAQPWSQPGIVVTPGGSV